MKCLLHLYNWIYNIKINSLSKPDIFTFSFDRDKLFFYINSSKILLSYKQLHKLKIKALDVLKGRFLWKENVHTKSCFFLSEFGIDNAPITSEFDYLPNFFSNTASALSSLYLIGMTILPLKSIYPYFLPFLDTFSTLSNLPSSLPIDVPKYCFISW